MVFELLSDQGFRMNKKCTRCNLINFASSVKCSRCNSTLAEIENIPSNGSFLKSNFLRRLGLFAYTFAFAITGFYVSLIVSAQSLTQQDAAAVERAVQVLEDKGFSREVFILRHMTSFLSRDHWLNASVLKENAYAATNFPFEIMTLYPDFFHYPVDDIERAAILLHEARHLQGGGEADAYEFVWRNRSRLGWTRDKYGASDVWNNVEIQTRFYAPQLFTCGLRSDLDCTE